MKMAERVESHYGTERRTAYAEHDKIFKLSSYFLCGGENIGNYRVLIVGEFRPAHEKVVHAAIFLHIVERILCLCLYGFELAVLDALVAERCGHHVIVIDCDAHGVAPFLGLVSHPLPPKNCALRTCDCARRI